MQNEHLRPAFEKWAADYFTHPDKSKAISLSCAEEVLKKDGAGNYFWPEIQDAWETWQAAHQPDIFIGSGTHFGGMPDVSKLSISFNSVSISFSGDAYLAMVAALDERIAENLQKAQSVYDNYWKKVNATSTLIKDIRNIFYEGDSDNYFAWRKPLEEVDRDELEKVLEQNSNLLGFE